MAYDEYRQAPYNTTARGGNRVDSSDRTLDFLNGPANRGRNSTLHAAWMMHLSEEWASEFPYTFQLLRNRPGVPLPRTVAPRVGVGDVTVENLQNRDNRWFKTEERWDEELKRMYTRIWNSLNRTARDAVKNHALFTAPHTRLNQGPRVDNVHFLLAVIELICLSPDGAPAPHINVEALDSLLSSKKEPGQSLDCIIRDVQTRARIVDNRMGFVLGEAELVVLVIRALGPEYSQHVAEIYRTASAVDGLLPPTMIHLREVLARLEGTLPTAAAAYAVVQQRAPQAHQQPGGSRHEQRGGRQPRPPKGGPYTHEEHQQYLERVKKRETLAATQKAAGAAQGGAQKSVRFADKVGAGSAKDQRTAAKGAGGKNQVRQANATAHDPDSSDDAEAYSVEFRFDSESWAFAAEHQDWRLILLDNAATNHLIGDPELMSNMQPSSPVIIKGASGTMTSSQRGHLNVLNVESQYLEGAPNLVSFAKLLKSYVIRLEEDESGGTDGGRYFSCTARDGSHTLVFVRYREVYPLLARADKGEKTCTWYNEHLWNTLSPDLERKIEGVLGWLPKDEELARAHRVINLAMATRAANGAVARAVRRSDGERQNDVSRRIASQLASQLAYLERRQHEERLRRANKDFATQAANEGAARTEGRLRGVSEEMFKAHRRVNQLIASLAAAGGIARSSAFATARESASKIRAKSMNIMGSASSAARKSVEKVVPSYSKAQVVRALEARHLENALGTSGAGLKRLLSNGHIVGTELEAKDVDRATNIWGSNITNRMTNPYRADTIPHVAKQGRTIEIDGGETTNTAHMDLLFVWGLIFLVATFRPSMMTSAIEVKSKSEEHLTAPLMSLVDGMRAAGFTVREVHVDGEASLASAKCVAAVAQHQIRLMKCTRGAHQAVIERENGLIRKRLTQILLLLPYRLPQDWVKFAVQHVLDMKAFCDHSDSTNSGPTAGELYYGRRLHERELIVTFGDCVTSRVPLDSRASKDAPFRDECIALNRNYGGDDSINLYSLRLKKIVNRKASECTLMMPTGHIIDIVNELADAQIKGAKTQFDAEYATLRTDDKMPADERQWRRITSSMADLYGSPKAEVDRLLRAQRFDMDKGDDERPDDGDPAEDDGDDDDDKDDDAPGPVEDDRAQTVAGAPQAHRFDVGFRFRQRFEEGIFGGTVTKVGPKVNGHVMRRVDYDDGDKADLYVWEIAQHVKENGAQEQIAAFTNASFTNFIGAVEQLIPELHEDDVFAAAVRVGGEREWPEARGKFEWQHEKAGTEDVERTLRLADRRLRSLKSYFTEVSGGDGDQLLAMSMSIKEAMMSYPAETVEANVKEMSQILNRALMPCDFKTLTSEQKKRAVPCIAFAKAKFHPHTSKFIKMKTRVVAAQSKSRQKGATFIEPSSPTLSRMGLFTLLAVATSRNWCISCIDIPGAYLTADRSPKSERLFGWLDKELTKIALMIDPSLAALLSYRGELWGQLGNLYGLVESGGAFWRKILKSLEDLGFKSSAVEPCLFHGMWRNKPYLVGLYVDDIIVSGGTESDNEALCSQIDIEYPGALATMARGSVITYLSCSIDCSEAGVTYVHQPDFARRLVDDYFEKRRPKRRNSPASLSLTTVDASSPALAGGEVDRFKSFLMRAAWLIQMTRYDCLVPLAFLSQRMHCCTEEDGAKLDHLIGYIAATIDYGITIAPGDGDLQVYCYTDSSLGTFPKGHSVSGAQITVANAVVYAACRKSSIVVKNIYEGEMLASSDFASQGLKARATLESIGIKQKPMTLYTDSASAIAGYKNKGPKQLTTRHMDLREYWLLNREESSDLELVHVPSELNVADVCTKAMVGALFAKMREWLLGWVPHPGPAWQHRDRGDAEE